MMSDLDFEEFAKNKMIDPPSGWRYGFPKIYSPKKGETMKDFLLNNGYPAEHVDVAVKYIRVINVA